jgi:hypothetical protein
MAITGGCCRYQCLSNLQGIWSGLAVCLERVNVLQQLSDLFLSDLGLLGRLDLGYCILWFISVLDEDRLKLFS